MDGWGAVARGGNVQLIASGARRGPAAGRNAGVRAATGDVILFLDADVCAQSDTVRRVRELFAADPSLDAVMGCYDDFPADPSFWSQYRNLLHSYYHRAGRERATTFWTGCGAIRRQVFLDFHGFDEVRYRRPSIEDIELGDRMYREGRQLRLDPSLLVPHLKRWTFWSILATDVP